MTLIFAFTHDLIQKGVKMETSYIAARRKQQTSGEELLDELVMDDQYEILFKRLFKDAHAEVIRNISVNYLMQTATDWNPTEFNQDRDFILFLNMHCDFPMQYKKSIEIKLEQFLIDYVCYRWLETKSPNDAATYASRLKPTIQDIQSLLIRKTNPLRRFPSFP